MTVAVALPLLEIAEDYQFATVVRPLATFPDNAKLGCPRPTAAFVKDVARNGVIEPIEIAQLTTGEEIILSGRRRIWASREIGRTTIRCLLYAGVEPEIARRWMLSLQHRSDNPITDVAVVRALILAGQTQKEMCDELNLTPQGLAKLLRLAGLDSAFLDALAAGKTTVSVLETVASNKPLWPSLMKVLKTDGKLTATDVKKAKDQQAALLKAFQLPVAGMDVGKGPGETVAVTYEVVEGPVGPKRYLAIPEGIPLYDTLEAARAEWPGCKIAAVVEVTG